MGKLQTLLLSSILAINFVYLGSQLCWAEESGIPPSYKPMPLKANQLNVVGSDSMDDLISVWVKAYRVYQPEISVQVVTRGSATAAPALIEGSADLAPISRPLKSTELEEFKNKYGFEPTQIKTGIAGVGIYVSAENPLDQISFEELEALFSAQPKRGMNDVTRWGDLNVQGKLSKQPVMLVGMSQSSYSYAYFKQSVLLQESFKPQVATVVDTKSLVATLSVNPNAIAFGPLFKLPNTLKVLSVSRKVGQPAISPQLNQLLSGEYPLSRFLSMCVIRYPDKPLDLETQDFLKFVLSKEGQALVAQQGFIPLPLPELKNEINKLG